MRSVILAAVLVALSASTWAQTAVRPTVVYLVRHGENTATQPSVLDATGKMRALELAATLKEVRFTHVFASHTERTRQMAEPIAMASRLPIVQLPRPGSTIDGQTVTEGTATGAAAKPLLEGIRAVPPGSTVLVAGNRENLFAIINDLGVPLCSAAPAGNPADNCVPCRDASCWGTWFDRLWIVSLTPGQPVRLIQLHYGR